MGKWYDSFKLGGETRDIKLRNMIHKHGTNIGQGSRADNYGQLILIHLNKRILGHNSVLRQQNSFHTKSKVGDTKTWYVLNCRKILILRCWGNNSP